MIRRRLLIILLLLVGGAIVNVAVAILGVIVVDKAPQTYLSPVSSSDAISLWQRHATDIWPKAPLNQTTHVGLFARRDLFQYTGHGLILYDSNAPMSVLRDTFRGIGSFTVEQTSAGFPARAMRRETWQGTPRSMFQANSGDDGLRIGKLTIPRTIVWPGFAINTVLYAVVVWLLFAGPFVVRRWRRIRRGLCPKCAYDLRGSTETEKCPECGSIVAS